MRNTTVYKGACSLVHRAMGIYPLFTIFSLALVLGAGVCGAQDLLVHYYTGGMAGRTIEKPRVLVNVGGDFFIHWMEAGEFLYYGEGYAENYDWTTWNYTDIGPELPTGYAITGNIVSVDSDTLVLIFKAIIWRGGFFEGDTIATYLGKFDFSTMNWVSFVKLPITTTLDYYYYEYRPVASFVNDSLLFVLDYLSGPSLILLKLSTDTVLLLDSDTIADLTFDYSTNPPVIIPNYSDGILSALLFYKSGNYLDVCLWADGAFLPSEELFDCPFNWSMLLLGDEFHFFIPDSFSTKHYVMNSARIDTFTIFPFQTTAPAPVIDQSGKVNVIATHRYELIYSRFNGSEWSPYRTLVEVDSTIDYYVGIEHYDVVCDSMNNIHFFWTYLAGNPLGGVCDLYHQILDTTKIAEEFIKSSPFLIITSPNPFNSSCAITVYGGRGSARQTLTEIEIYDLRGNVVYADGVGVSFMKPHNENGFDESNPYIWTPDKNTPSGIYFVKAKMADGNSITKRIVYLK